MNKPEIRFSTRKSNFNRIEILELNSFSFSLSLECNWKAWGVAERRVLPFSICLHCVGPHPGINDSNQLMHSLGWKIWWQSVLINHCCRTFCRWRHTRRTPRGAPGLSPAGGGRGRERPPGRGGCRDPGTWSGSSRSLGGGSSSKQPHRLQNHIPAQVHSEVNEVSIVEWSVYIKFTSYHRQHINIDVYLRPTTGLSVAFQYLKTWDTGHSLV